MNIIKSKIKNFFKIEYAQEIELLRYVKYLEYCFKGGMFTPFEVYRRSRIDVFDYEKLSKPLFFFPFVTGYENNLYGNGYIISRAFKKIDLSTTTIEHGLYLGSIVPERHLLSLYKNVITFSKYRKNFITTQTDKNIITIGPYIKYADSLLSNKRIEIIKKKLGKTLLVFPCHSIDCLYTDYDVEEFMKYIIIFKDLFNFEKVLICLYWKDISLNKHLVYIEAGFEIVTAGHIYDKYFLNRLKAILLLSDAALTNEVGTHVGYSIALNKPIKIWSDGRVFRRAISGKESEAAYELGMRENENLTTSNEAIKNIKSVFSEFNNKISDLQKDCVKYYWGS